MVPRNRRQSLNHWKSIHHARSRQPSSITDDEFPTFDSPKSNTPPPGANRKTLGVNPL